MHCAETGFSFLPQFPPNSILISTSTYKHSLVTRCQVVNNIKQAVNFKNDYKLLKNRKDYLALIIVYAP